VGVVIAVVLVALATLAAWAMDAQYSLASQAIVYLMAVVVAAFFVGGPTSIVTTVLAVLALNFFYIPPRYTLDIDQEYLVDFAAMIVVSVVVSGLAARLRAQTARAREGERRARETYALAESIGGRMSEGELAQIAVHALHKAFGVPCCLVLKSPEGGLARAAQAPETAAVAVDLDAAAWVVDNPMTIGPTTGYWPRLPAWYVPMPAEPGALGVAVIEVGESTARGEEDRRHAEALARQIAVAIGRARLGAQAEAAARDAAAESVRSALLASISHDFRTPLAVIVGAAGTLAAERDRLDEGKRAALLATIEHEATQMSAIAENILQLARLSSGPLALRRDWQSIEEVVGSVVGRHRRRGSGRRLSVHLTNRLPLVRADAVLLSQVLSNLIDNAVRHAPGDSPIEIEARGKDDTVEVAVKDRGPGLGDGDPARFFESFVRGRTETDSGGVGLGLAIARAVIEAHGGRIWARNRPGGGAEFRFTLPAAAVERGADDALGARP
jgi:two-component system sensor histidine kinase KdpD